MVNVNWLPVPGFLTALLGFACLFVATLANRRPWAARVWTYASAGVVAGLLALLLGVFVAVCLAGVK